MLLRDKKVIVLGLARSGLAACKALHRRGALIYAHDRKGPEQLGADMDALQTMAVKVYAGLEPPVETIAPDLAVVSPGIPLDTELVRRIYALNIPVIGELELAYQLKSPQLDMYAVTGTNGKTTTTAWLNDMLLRDGRKSTVGGNIGVALCDLVDQTEQGVIVVEVSSFQLETMATFHPHICGILNITPDHLDRHQTMAEYTRIKGKVFQHQTDHDYLVLNFDDPRVRGFADHARGQVLFFSRTEELESGIYIAAGAIWARWQGEQQRILDTEEIRLRGGHNQENALCTVAMAWVAGVSPAAIQASLASFGGVRHRLEEVAFHEGIMYINDSKGTNPDSTIKALEAFDQPIVLIAGGRAKGGSYAQVAEVIVAKAKALVLLGEARSMLRDAVMSCGMSRDAIHEVEDLTAAVYQARQLAAAGDVVLLSPACASWDMFPSYEHRGDLFCQVVNDIAARCGER